MDVNAYLARAYPSPPCWALVADVFARELGQGVADYQSRGDSVRAVADAFRLALHDGLAGFHRVERPTDFCVAILGRRANGTPHHCGVVYHRRVLHALASGTVYQDMATLRDAWPLVEFWAPDRPVAEMSESAA